MSVVSALYSALMTLIFSKCVSFAPSVSSPVPLESAARSNQDGVNEVEPPPGQSVFVPPDIKYWAYGELNTTVYDNQGLPWFCYTNLQTHCIPLFRTPPNFRTTRKPFHSNEDFTTTVRATESTPPETTPLWKDITSATEPLKPAADDDTEEPFRTFPPSNEEIRHADEKARRELEHFLQRQQQGEEDYASELELEETNAISRRRSLNPRGEEANRLDQAEDEKPDEPQSTVQMTETQRPSSVTEEKTPTSTPLQTATRRDSDLLTTLSDNSQSAESVTRAYSTTGDILLHESDQQPTATFSNSEENTTINPSHKPTSTELEINTAYLGDDVATTTATSHDTGLGAGNDRFQPQTGISTAESSTEHLKSPFHTTTAANNGIDTPADSSENPLSEVAAASTEMPLTFRTTESTTEGHDRAPTTTSFHDDNEHVYSQTSTTLTPESSTERVKGPVHAATVAAPLEDNEIDLNMIAQTSESPSRGITTLRTTTQLNHVRSSSGPSNVDREVPDDDDANLVKPASSTEGPLDSEAVTGVSEEPRVTFDLDSFLFIGEVTGHSSPENDTGADNGHDKQGQEQQQQEQGNERFPKQTGKENNTCLSCNIARNFSQETDPSEASPDGVILLPGDVGYHWTHEYEKDHLVPGGSSTPTTIVSSEVTAESGEETLGTTQFPTSSPTTDTTQSPLNGPLQGYIPTVGIIPLVTILGNITKTIQNDTDVEPTASPALLVQAYTVFGEPCKDQCENRGYSYTWCTKVTPSKVGTWTETDYCSPRRETTQFGERCTGPCQRQGYDYYWCNTRNSSWGFCTPDHLLDTISPRHYTAYGDPCLNECAYRENSYTSCSRRRNGVITEEFCSISHNITHRGKNCTDECLQRERPFFWCTTHAGTYEYCTPSEEHRDMAQSTTEKEPPVKVLAYTVFGEACRTECAHHDGYKYTWCHKVKPSRVGHWKEGDYCTNASDVTPFGEACEDDCARRGFDYFWCHKVKTLWGFCTPKHLLESLDP